MMNEKDVLDGIQSTSPKLVLNSLISLADFLDQDAINSEFLNTSFHLLIPLISSNHFKIRSNSLIILSDILDNWYDSISDAYLALPGSLLALLSVNKIVSKCGISCLKQILQNENPIVYWPDIEKTITSSRSLEVRIQVLEMLTIVSDKIPLNPIVKLIDDPKYQIRRAALELLQTVDTNKLKEAARSVKISYEAMKLLFTTCPELGDIDSLDPNYSKEPFASKTLSIRSKSRSAQDNDNNNNLTSQNKQPVILQSSKLLRTNLNQNSRPLFTSTRQYKSRIPTINSKYKSQQNETEKSSYTKQTKINATASNDFDNSQKNKNLNKSKPPISAASKTINKNNRNNNNSNYRNDDDFGDIGIVVRNSRDDLLSKVRTLPQRAPEFNENQDHSDEPNKTIQNLKKQFFIEEEEEELEIEIELKENVSFNQLPQTETNDKSQQMNNNNNNNDENENENIINNDDLNEVNNSMKNDTAKKLKITTQSSPTVFEKVSTSNANSPAPPSDNEYASPDQNSSQKKKKKKIIKQKSASNSSKKSKSPPSRTNNNDNENPPQANSGLSTPTANQAAKANSSKMSQSLKQTPTESNANNSSRFKQSPTDSNNNNSRIKQSPGENNNNNNNSRIKQSPSESNNNNSNNSRIKQSPVHNDGDNENSRMSTKSSRIKQSPSDNNNDNGSSRIGRSQLLHDIYDDDANYNDMHANFNDNFYEEEVMNENFANSSSNLLQKKQNHNMKRESSRSVSFNEPVGHLEMAPKISIEYRPQDLAETTWLEKITFLDSMGAALATNQQFTDSPLDLIDCVLITAYPPHQKVTFMIPPILSELILRYPEVVRKRLTELVTFSLFTMVGDEWQEDGGFDKFLSVFILESDPTDLIETALKVTDETERKLPFELLIMCVYEEIPEMKLPYSVVSHLVCNILKRFPLNESQEELFTFICERELEFVRKYGMKLPLDARHKIVTFLRKSEKFNATETQSVSSRTSQQKQKSQAQQQQTINIPSNESSLMKIIQNEFKVGPKKSNLQRCLLALTALDPEMPLELFVNFLNYLGKFTETVIYENEEELSKLCMKHFTSNKYLKFLDASYVLPETIVGFSKIVWCSPQGLLQGADEYLLSLYEIFKNSNGKVRIDIIKIVIAINKVTGTSILDFEEVVEPYRKLISSLIAQFHYQK